MAADSFSKPVLSEGSNECAVEIASCRGVVVVVVGSLERKVRAASVFATSNAMSRSTPTTTRVTTTPDHPRFTRGGRAGTSTAAESVSGSANTSSRVERRAARMSFAEAKRSPGARDIARITVVSRSAGISVRTSDGLVGSRCMRASASAAGVSARNGASPHTAS